MSTYIQTSFCVFLAVFISVYYQKTVTINYSTTAKDPYFLVIGILSARENFVLREEARLSWLNEYSSNNNNSVKYLFIVGNEFCEVHPDYRQSNLGCEKWNINISSLEKHFTTAHGAHAEECPPESLKIFYQGFSFKVNHPLVVTKLGILSSLLLPNVETRVAILDIQSRNVVVEALVSVNESDSTTGYTYKEVEAVLLPQGYEGMVLVEGYLRNAECATVKWNDGGGVLTFKRIYSTPSHLDSIKFSPNSFIGTSIGFFIHDINNLMRMLRKEDSMMAKWSLYQKNLNEELIKESQLKKDILFVNATDTYRNLPTKLLLFYNWLSENLEFCNVMKTDDDSVVHIPLLLQKLKTRPIFKSTTPWIWSNFRKEWPLNYIGKWADYDYQSTVYPSFPCGAAYVMSNETIYWLNSNLKYLYPYQGEDVSMGIWLSAINPTFIEDKNFECDSQCSQNSYNRAQLEPKQIQEVWSLLEKCGNLCFCVSNETNAKS